MAAKPVAAKPVVVKPGAPNPFAQVLEQQRSKQDIPGVVAVVVQHGRVVFEGGVGLADVAAKRPMTAKTVVYPGSLSKLFTTVAVLQLLESKQVELDIPVVRWVPRLGSRPSQRRITTRHLLAHTSGLPSEANFSYWFSGEFPDASEVVESAASAWIGDVPIPTSSYSNLGFAVLGQLVQNVTKRPYLASLQRTVLGPLGMTSTGGGCPTTSVARGYTPKDGPIPSSLVPFAGVGEKVGDRFLREYCDANGMSPAFGLYTTAHDMGPFISLLLGRKPSNVLTPAALRRLGERQAGGRGLGIRIVRRNGSTLLRHDGWFAAHRSHVLLDRAAGIGIYVTANADDAAPDVIAQRLWEFARANR